MLVKVTAHTDTRVELNCGIMANASWPPCLLALWLAAVGGANGTLVVSSRV